MHPILAANALDAMLAEAGSRLIAIFAGFAHAAAPLAVDAFWQGALVAVALVLCLRFAPRVSATHRFAIWASAFAVVAGLPFLPVIVHSSMLVVATTFPQDGVAAKPWFHLDSRWEFMVAALWLGASLMRAADLAFHSVRLRRLWRSAVPVPVDTGLSSLLAAVFPTRRRIEICKTRELDRPSVIGFFAPRILIPDWLFERLTPGELEHVALHETEHLRRRDDWTNLLQKISLVLFPLNPALVWMERRLCREREMACDEGVVRRTQAPRAYAACLTSLAERSLNRRAHALSLGAFERRPELVHRVHSILKCKRALSPLAARAWVGAVGCGLLFGAVELARCPQVVAFVPEKTGSAAHEQAKGQKRPAAHAIERAAASPVRQPGLTIATARTTSAEGLRAPAQFKAIDTKAILPERRIAGAPLPVASRHLALGQFSGPEQRLVASFEKSVSIPREVLLKAEEPGASAAAAHETGFIVFTAWEQVRSLPAENAQVADYDRGAGNRVADREAEGREQPQSTDQITAARVILVVYPVDFAPGANAKQATGSRSGQPTAVPFDGGWLVFRL
jgi:beta-lactamase regulating signal transducer with metallopeptidase domain